VYEFLTIDPKVKELWEKEEVSENLRYYLEQAVVIAKEFFPARKS